MFKKIGPGVLVAAAFIGPGTVTTCMIAGVSFGYSLLWSLLISVIATIIIQEMAARIGLITRKGLGNMIATEIAAKGVRYSIIFLVLGAIVFGNAAYEGGNIGGATLGLQAIFGMEHTKAYPIIIGLLATFFLLIGNYKLIEKILITLVFIMSASFLFTAFITKPDVVEILKGLLVPKTPTGGLLILVALVGTTIVPYNLFLHASIVSEKWHHKENLKDARRDTMISIGLGGLVSMAIVITAAQTEIQHISDVADLTKGLEPVYGLAAKYLMGTGLFAAGLTSSITAPLAAAYVANSCFGWNAGVKDFKFRLVWGVIIVLGVIFMLYGIKPIEVIKTAQIANGLLLPIMVVFLLWAANKESVMGKYKNTVTQNVLGCMIAALSVLLCIVTIDNVFGLFD